jgi:hypothetical protein
MAVLLRSSVLTVEDNNTSVLEGLAGDRTAGTLALNAVHGVATYQSTGVVTV